MFSGIISALGNVKNITYNNIYSIDIEITKIHLEDFEKSRKCLVHLSLESSFVREKFNIISV